MMQEIVVDTNVAVVANGDTGQANLKCVRACSQFLERVLKGDFCILLDAQDCILREYRRQLMHSRKKTQKRLGAAFFKWLWDNQAVKNRCRKIVITPNETRGFDEFPDDSDLEKFDFDDRKFVAVSCASGTSAEIFNASDTDWWRHKDALARHEIMIVFLCRELMPTD